MKIVLHHAGLKLGLRQLLCIRHGPGCAILVHEGSLWITQQGDIRDVVLQPGKLFVIDRPGLTLIEAVAPAEIAIAGIATTWLRRFVCYVVEAGGAALPSHPRIVLRGQPYACR